jgi:hypothetical protein
LPDIGSYVQNHAVGSKCPDEEPGQWCFIESQAVDVIVHPNAKLQTDPQALIESGFYRQIGDGLMLVKPQGKSIGASPERAV